MRLFRRFQLLIARLSATRPSAWFVRTCVQPLDRLVLRITGGRMGVVSLVYPTLVLITTGARSGVQRRTPLLFLPDGNRVVLVASNFGRDRHPGWYYNLRANPQAQVNIYGHTFTCWAREATGIEYLELWERAVRYYPGFAVYARRAGRTIPIVVLDISMPT
ncbi:nitroreductase family deazaflavin-dependent oxidoreductase [Chloroflexus sp.]|uniref:nitroreductase family deazaflavin-dependent oxidoreductase n=1 Tax=Chloroflexus sp. TaxID=1904827 RepID=UPI002ACE3C64|nr:nitroreductase family deazaflavin-dependent oxidoreductase [Chloroflexus sp.]